MIARWSATNPDQVVGVVRGPEALNIVRVSGERTIHCLLVVSSPTDHVESWLRIFGKDTRTEVSNVC